MKPPLGKVTYYGKFKEIMKYTNDLNWFVNNCSISHEGRCFEGNHRVVSRFYIPGEYREALDDSELYIITECDRENTYILLSKEYDAAFFATKAFCE